MAISIKTSTDTYRIQTPVSGKKVKKTFMGKNRNTAHDIMEM